MLSNQDLTSFTKCLKLSWIHLSNKGLRSYDQQRLMIISKSETDNRSGQNLAFNKNSKIKHNLVPNMASGGQHYQIPGSNGNRGAPFHSGFVEIKSKFDAEFRRFTLNRDKYRTFESFRELLEVLHLLKGSPSDNIPPTPFHISYVDPKDNDLLPINNTDNYLRALQTAKPVLRLVVQRHGELQETYYTGRRVPSGAGTSLLTSMLGTSTPGGKSNKPLISISQPSEFRQVAAIIDPDQVPDTCRRVRLLKHGSDKPLGFYIRDGTSGKCRN